MKNRQISDQSLQIDSLDGLRGFAALVVVFSHTSNKGWHFIPYLDLGGIGKSGVFLFFLLSAFLLTAQLLKKGNNIFTREHLSHFWQRRFFRIYPLYTLFLIGVLISSFLLTQMFNKPGIGIPFYLDWPSFFEHVFLIDGRGISWSIAVEFKFYFILPFIAFALYKAYQVGFWFSLAFMFCLILLTQIIFPQSLATDNDVRLLPYLVVFLFGMTLAIIQFHINENFTLSSRARKFINLSGILALLTIFLMAPDVFSNLFWEIPRGYFHRDFIQFSLVWSVVFFAAVNGQGIITRFFAHPWMRYFGMISFSLYLFHNGIIHIFRYADFVTPVNAWIVLLLTTILSHVTYKIIERPSSTIKINWSKLYRRKNLSKDTDKQPG